jgi:hypothetical protein
MGKRFLILFITLFVAMGAAQAQQVEYMAEVDTNYLLIGDQVHLRLKVKAEAGVKVDFPLLQDTVVRGLEILSGPLRDSTYYRREKRVLLEESYALTSFDTGVYMIPPMPIRVTREGYSTILQTDPVMLVVSTYDVDLQKGYADILPLKGAPWVFAELLSQLSLVLLGLLGLAVCAGGVWLVCRMRSKVPLFSGGRPVVPPYVLAIQALDEVKESKPWQRGKTKEYYTRLTEILRAYLEGELKVPALEQTTREILQALETHEEVMAADREDLEQLLETADLVKFAKATPLPDEDVRHLNVAYGFVNHVNECVQAQETEEASEAV